MLARSSRFRLGTGPAPGDAGWTASRSQAFPKAGPAVPGPRGAMRESLMRRSGGWLVFS